MATLKVQDNGNAPSNAKVGDHIVTAGGTYQVLDSAQYQGKSPEELASAGVGYNPSSGLYSKKISDVTNNIGKSTASAPAISLRTPDTARQWANQQNQKVSADLDSAYYQNRQDAYNSYMDAITRQNQQANDVNASYLDNISRLYDNTYQNNNAVLERMASRGLTSSGLGNAMQVAALADASKKNADLRFQRNRDLNNIETEMNNLTNQYNINLDTLAKKLRSDKISALSQNEIAFLEAVMAIEEGNMNAENSASMMQYQLANEAEQAMLQREFQADQNQKDRELQLLIQSLGGSGGSYGGGGGYRRGGRGYGGYRGYYGYGSGSDSSGYVDPFYPAANMFAQSSDYLTDEQRINLYNSVANLDKLSAMGIINDAVRQERQTSVYSPNYKPTQGTSTKKTSSKGKSTTKKSSSGSGSSAGKSAGKAVSSGVKNVTSIIKR